MTNSSVRLIFLGPPGAGKGTQSQSLAKILGIAHISTGEILRKSVKERTPLGKQAQEYMDKGELVPDQLILNLIRERLQESDTQKGWILDGFPRNVKQAEFLDSLLREMNQFADWVINLEVPNKALLERLLARGRKDDTQETISRRLEVYREQTKPVIDYYQACGKLKSIDGNRLPEKVTDSLKEIISS